MNECGREEKNVYSKSSYLSKKKKNNIKEFIKIK